MRKKFSELVYNEMRRNDNIYVITADLGYKMWDKVRDEFPERFHNVGSAEQLMLGVGVGLALSGKIPILYSITPFLLYRPAEWIRLYLQHEQIPVKLVGSGRGKDYEIDGFTHWDDEIDMIDMFYNIEQYRPEDITRLDLVDFNKFLYSDKPAYLNLRR